LRGLADDADVYLATKVIQSVADQESSQARRFAVRGQPRVAPQLGSEIGWISPFPLIAKSAYPEHLQDAAIRRLRRSNMQSEYDESYRPILLRNSSSTPGGSLGTYAPKAGFDGRPFGILEIAATGAGQDAVLRTLIHEARHATEKDTKSSMRALPSITAGAMAMKDGTRLTEHSRRYFAKPSEVLAYLSEAGDDFVRDRGRLVENIRDANAVIEMLESGAASPDLSPHARSMYVNAYRGSKTARGHINDILTRYFSVPGAAAMYSSQEDNE
jgi:hypothetical protein